jgi:hypothetical protein
VTSSASRITARLAAVAGFAAFLAASLLARGGEAPRMRVATPLVSAGDHVLVRFDAPPVRSRGRGAMWLTLVPAESAEGFVGERVVLDEGAAEATISAIEEGSYELRLISVAAGTAAVVARARVEVAKRVTARREPPAWYW